MANYKAVSAVFIALTVVFAATAGYLFAYPNAGNQTVTVEKTTTLIQSSTFTSTVCCAAGTANGASASSSTSSSTSLTSTSAASSRTSGEGTLSIATSTNTAFHITITNGSSTNQNSTGYSPSSVTVVIGPNNTIVWTNTDSAIHTVTFSSLPSGLKPFSSGDIAPGHNYTYTFTVPGTYQYHCDYHAWMQGTITVEDYFQAVMGG